MHRLSLLVLAACATQPAAPTQAPSPVTTPAPAPSTTGWTRDQAFSQLALALPTIEVQHAAMMRSRGVTRRRAEKLKLGSLVDALLVYSPHTSLLVYQRQGNELRAWLVDRAGLVAWGQTTAPRADIDRALRSLRTSIGATTSSDPASGDTRGLIRVHAPPEHPTVPWPKAARTLRDLILPASIRPALAATEHLVIQPIEDLGTVPFALLPVGDGEQALLERMTISIAPDLGHLVNQATTWDGAFSSPLLVGAPQWGAHPDYVLRPLPGTLTEVTTVGRRLSAVPLTGAAANETEVAQRAASADLILLSTHAISGSQDALDKGFLALAPGDDTDGWWTAREIQEQHLDEAKLVVLSACETGLGRVHEAGMIGLARAFQIAGADHLVMTLWELPDAETPRIIDELIGNAAKQNPAAALRATALAARDRGAPPLLWGVLAHFGVPR